MGNLGLHMFGICDGHGLHGHLVSNFIKNLLATKILSYIPLNLIQTKSIENIEHLYSKLP